MTDTPVGSRKHRFIVFLFFLIYFCVGIAVFRDYGISTDENVQRHIGHVAAKYVAQIDPKLPTSPKIKYHGQIVEIALAAAEWTLPRGVDLRTVYLLRHILTFLIFYGGVYCFYLLCTYLFSDWKIGLLGSIFLVLSPRIFADSFYNSKDIPFLAVCIVCIYTLLKYLDDKTLKRTAVHAAACALLIAIRITGIMLPVITVFFVLADSIEGGETRAKLRTALGRLAVYAAFLIPMTILFWPTLWSHPLDNFVASFKIMSHFPWKNYNLYLGGQLHGGTSLPWHYVPVWLIVTTPLLYVCFALVGILVLLKSIIDPRGNRGERRNAAICLTWFFMPLAAVIMFHSVLYTGWRQMFFIYPAFLILSLTGLTSIHRFLRDELRGVSSRVMRSVLVALVCLGLAGILYSMVTYHPYQNLYFNMLTGGLKGARNNFEMDYWGLSYREGLEYILKTDADDPIPFSTYSRHGKDNLSILSKKDRTRLVYVPDILSAKYFLTNFRGGSPMKTLPETTYPYEKYYAVTRDGVEILVVYKIRD